MRHLYFAMLLAFCFARTAVADVYISQDTTIDAAHSFPDDRVDIYDGDDGPTTVFMVDGGFARQFNAYDRSVVYVSGGGTTNSDMNASDDATLYFSGGVVADDLRSRDRSVIHITGGEVLHGSTHATDEGTINIHGGLFSHLGVDGNGTINVFGRELAYATPDQTRLVGILADGSPLDVPVQRFDTGVIALHIVPEPTALTLSLAAITGMYWMAVRTRRGRILG
jgi:hypothetical protein